MSSCKAIGITTMVRRAPVARMLLWLAALLLAVWQPAFAQEFPKLTGRVVDNANLLSVAEENQLAAQLQQLEAQSGRQLVVATIADLQGYPIEDYGYQLGRSWGIGAEDKDDGALLIVAPNERKVRIEVGYGLEPVLTDAASHYIIQDEILPRFKDGNMPAGIMAGAGAIAELLSLPPEEARQKLAEYEQANKGSRGGGIPIFFIIFILFFFVIPMFRGTRGGRRYGRSPVMIWGPPMGGGWGGSSGGSSWGGGGGFGGGGFGGGGGSFGGGGASGGW